MEIHRLALYPGTVQFFALQLDQVSSLWCTEDKGRNPTIMETFIELLGALAPYAWPVTTALLVLFVVLVFEEQLADLIRRMRTLPTPFGNAEFAYVVSQVREAQEDLGAAAIEGELDEQVTLDIAEDPRVAVLESWIRLEQTARQAIRHASPQLADRRRRNLLRSLEETGLIDGPTYGMLRKLRDARNQAAHEVDWRLTPEAVREYVTMAEGLRTRIEAAADSG